MAQKMGPGPAHRSETTSTAAPVAATPGGSFGAGGYARPLAGLIMVVALVAILVLAAGMFRGSFSSSVPVTVISQRAGLVMNPDAKVKLHGVQVGRVTSIEERPDGMAALHLAMDPSQLSVIPANVLVNIAAPTVFGAKAVQLVLPPDPSPQPLRSGQVLDAQSVTVETNTLFQQLVSMLSKIEPAKLNETLGAIASGVHGRGHKIGQMLKDLDSLLATLDPSLANMRHDIEVAPEVVRAYADASPDLVATLDNTTKFSQTIIDKQTDLDALLVSAAGLADIGNDVVGTNRQALTDTFQALTPTTDLLSEYAPGLNCSLNAIMQVSKEPPQPLPGAMVSVGLTLGVERYRYPGHLPKVAATGGPHCADLGLPDVPPGFNPPYLVANTGANPWQYGNQGILLNSDGLKQMLYGPLDGPPRNSSMFGMPG